MGWWGIVDARPLVSHDAKWNVTLLDSTTSEQHLNEEAEVEGTKILDRQDELLGKVGEGRKYQGFFVVDRT